MYIHEILLKYNTGHTRHVVTHNWMHAVFVMLFNTAYDIHVVSHKDNFYGL